MKGIILAAGEGTRLSPATLPISKILLPVYDRPMIYYPLSTLMLAGVKDILIIINEKDQQNFKRTLGDGSQFGIKIQYAIQYVQKGIVDAFIIGKEFIGDENVALILGDNIIYSENIKKLLSDKIEITNGALIYGCNVPDPERFGVIEFDKDNNVLSIEEKPKYPKSTCASVGLYFYDKNVTKYALKIKPSARGELEITDLNKIYLDKNELSVRLFNKDTRWIDAGTFKSLLDASNFIYEIEKKIKKKILCPELTAYELGYVNKNDLKKWVNKHKMNDYYMDVLKEIDNE